MFAVRAAFRAPTVARTLSTSTGASPLVASRDHWGARIGYLCFQYCAHNFFHGSPSIAPTCRSRGIQSDHWCASPAPRGTARSLHKPVACARARLRSSAAHTPAQYAGYGLPCCRLLLRDDDSAEFAPLFLRSSGWWATMRCGHGNV